MSPDRIQRYVQFEMLTWETEGISVITAVLVEICTTFRDEEHKWKTENENWLTVKGKERTELCSLINIS